MSDSPNPYQSPVSVDSEDDGFSDEEAAIRLLRKKHLGRERSIRAIAIPYWIAALICIVAGVSLSIAVGVSFASLLALLLSLPLLATGYGLRKLHPSAKIPVAILSSLGLVIMIPVGTLINGYILYLIFSEKGNVVFSPAYRQAIEATPELNDRTSPWIWLVLLLLMGAGVIMFFKFQI